MALPTLKPRLPLLNTTRIKVLDTKAGTTERIRGSAWMTIRRAVLLRDHYTCTDCGRVSQHNEIDHHVPLEQGGSNDASNLKVRCIKCHKVKTAIETNARYIC